MRHIEGVEGPTQGSLGRDQIVGRFGRAVGWERCFDWKMDRPSRPVGEEERAFPWGGLGRQAVEVRGLKGENPVGQNWKAYQDLRGSFVRWRGLNAEVNLGWGGELPWVEWLVRLGSMYHLQQPRQALTRFLIHGHSTRTTISTAKRS